MHLKHSVMIGLMGRQADRFHEYQIRRNLPERLEMVKQVRGVDGIEIVYPADFGDPQETAKLVRESGLAVSAVNLNVKSAKKWRHGSFTSPDPQRRREAIADLKTAMDLAVELGAGMVTCCPLIDGHNYPFEVDYLHQWRWLEEGIAEAARHKPEVRLSLEYKLNEARNYIILGDMGRTLFLCERLGLPNVGVTMDVGHALVAKETPAEALCLAAHADRLFYVHFNDNGREWDWDMLPGSVNLWDLVETLYYLDRLDWSGWLAYDVLSRSGGPVETIQSTIDILHAGQELLDKIGRGTLEELIAAGNPERDFARLVRALL
jgi:xylose isomerase